MSFNFKTLSKLKIPKPARILGWIVITGMVITILILTYTPWVQTVNGDGTVTTRYPNDRVQQINALVEGRITEWFVTDGDTVKKGEPIARIIDNDPLLLERLNAKKEAVTLQLNTIAQAVQTANLNYKRRKNLFEQKLGSRIDKENALLQVQKLRARHASLQAELNKVEIKLSRQSLQLITAPRDGVIIGVHSGDSSTFVTAGQALATFVPANIKRIAEIKVPGRDIPLIKIGHKARLQFSGWPSLQFSGWPSVAIGTFSGVVTYVDPVADLNGLFRVMVAEDKRDEPWPDQRFTMLGTKVRAWILLDTVALGYELWRRLNTFPPEFPNVDDQIRK